jgi:hypothetical protein
MKLTRVAIFLVLLLCGACNLTQQGSSVTPTVAIFPTDAVATTPEVGLSTYTNTAYGYSIQYPSGLELEGAADSQYIWLDQQIYVYVSENNPEDARGDGPVIEITHDAMLGQNTARYLNGYIGAVGGNTPQRYESFVIKHNNLYYQFTAYELKRSDVQPVDRTMSAVPAEVAALLMQIVTSLRFAS